LEFGVYLFLPGPGGPHEELAMFDFCSGTFVWRRKYPRADVEFRGNVVRWEAGTAGIRRSLVRVTVELDRPVSGSRVWHFHFPAVVVRLFLEDPGRRWSALASAASEDGSGDLLRWVVAGVHMDSEFARHVATVVALSA